MTIYGIIAEYNPFHNGHKFLLDYAKARADRVVCAVSGNFTQRGEPAIYPKQSRARAALLSGADAVVEMPTVYSMSTAQNFALCGVLSLANMGVDTIVFGSESGDIKELKKAARVLLGDGFKNALKEQKEGETFAVIRQRAAEACGVKAGLLENPNDNLGIEYMLAALAAGIDMDFIAVRREGVSHNGEACGEYASASYIRGLIRSGKTDEASKYMPPSARFLLDEPASDISYAERAVLALLRSKTAEELALLPDLSEGIENRLLEGIKKAASLDELYSSVKTKRYTLARVRRLVMSAALGFDNTFFMKAPPYERILGSKPGFDDEKTGRLFPVVSRVGEINALGDEAKKLFLTENSATDIYALTFKAPLECGTEYKMKYIKE